MKREDVAANLHDLAIDYERLEAERNTLYGMVEELQASMSQNK